MKLKFLGTAAAEGWPGIFCACDVCMKAKELGGKNIRTRSSIMLNDVVKIDIPPDTYHHILTYSIDMRKVQYLLITHSHDDHFLPSELVYAEPPFVAGTPSPSLTVMGPKPVIDIIMSHVNLARSPLLPIEIEPFVSVKKDDWEFTPIIGSHMTYGECYNYLITYENKTLLYASDTGWYSDETWRFLATKHIDYAVIECTTGGKESDYSGHLSISGLLKMRNRLIEMDCLKDNSPVIATHFSHNGGLLHEELEERLNPYGVEVAYDGKEMCFDTM
jgi:phosphoribosyl 1,2-cyclic phosphate phosphodiesterase